MKDRINKINLRLTAIETELRTATDVDAIEKLSGESTQLIEERGRLIGQLSAEARNALNNPAKVENLTDGETDQNIVKMSTRNKLMLIAGKQARGKAFTDAEKRALGTSLTTTAETYVPASAGADGVNNGGIFIQANVLLDLLKEEGKLSPILKDIHFTSIPGMVEYVYRKSRTAAEAKKEGKGSGDGQIEWAKMSLTKGWLQLVIPVTDELKALTDFGFGEYIINQISEDLNEDWSSDLIYGTGTDDHIKGITVGATTVTYTAGKALEGIIEAIKKSKGKFRKGAKVYVDQSIYDDVLFSLDANGNFKYPIFNNSTGITSVGTARMELDENLKEGDFIVGNVSKYYKANILIPLRLETDRHARKGVTDYIASEYCAAAPFDGAFIHGKKTA